jgi:DNA primase
MVSQVKQIFHCFGCGAGGDIISFLMKHDNIPFQDAVHYLAKKAGIEIITDIRRDHGKSTRRENLLKMNEEAMKYFMNTLQASPAVLSYLGQRSVNAESRNLFSLGYAASRRDTLFQYLKNMGYTEQLLSASGLVAADDRGYRDWFRGRIMFPIMNIKNDIIAFGGRVMDDSLPKYINSPETEIFKKSEILFAMNLAKDDIRKKGYALIVEGYLDVIICHQYGFKNAIAPLGTALTPGHLQSLKTLTKKAVLIFDADDAGVAAARRSLSILCENDFRAKVMLLPHGEDPDSFLRKHGAQPFKHLLSDAVSMVKFLLTTSKGDVTDTVRETLGIIALMKDMIVADELLAELSDRVRIHESTIRSELEKIRKRPGRQESEAKPPTEVLNREEYLLLGAILFFPEKAGDVLSRVSIDEIRDETVRAIFGKIHSHPHIDSLLETADDREKSLITGILLKPGFDLERVDRNIKDCLDIIQKKRLEERRRLAEESGDIVQLDSLLKEKRRMIKRAHP